MVLSAETADKFNRRVVEGARIRKDVREEFKRQIEDCASPDGEENPATEINCMQQKKKRKIDFGVSVFDQTSCRSSDFFLGQSAAPTSSSSSFDLSGLENCPSLGQQEEALRVDGDRQGWSSSQAEKK
jgi:hypothetical protein